MSHTSPRFLSIFRTVERDKMKALQNTKGNIYAYSYKGVTIRQEGLAFSFWRAALGYDMFSQENIKLYFDNLQEAKAWIDQKKVGA